jgi:hypothetical protein
MITVTTDITIPTSGETIYLRVFAKQNDAKSRFLRIKLVDGNGNQVNVTGTGYRVYIRAIKPDKTQIFDTCTVDNEGYIVAPLSDQFLACAGIVKTDIAIYSNNEEVLSSSVFYVDVVKSSYDEDGVISSDEFSALTEALSDAQNAVGIASTAAESANTAAENANTATSNAQAATQDAIDAVAAIYHDKNFLLSVNADNSLTLTYNDETEE